MVTFTLRHNRTDALDTLLTGMAAARRGMRGGGAFMKFKKRVGYLGTIRSLEITHGAAGWHPHLHELWFVSADADLDYCEKFLRSRWAASVAAVGLAAGNHHAFDLRMVRDDADLIASYLNKIQGAGGAAGDSNWDISSELARANTKMGRAGGRSPFVILGDAAMGDARSSALFREYASATKRLASVAWSPGLRAALIPCTKELTDEEIAAQKSAKGEPMVLLSAVAWRLVCRNALRAELLAVADAGDFFALVNWLIEHELDYSLPLLPYLEFDTT